MSAEYDNDELVFLDEDTHQELEHSNKREWNILIVDDDEEIHNISQSVFAIIANNNAFK